jgi:hypothetical protein
VNTRRSPGRRLRRFRALRRVGAYVMGAVAMVLVALLFFTPRRPPIPSAALAECRALYDSARTLRDTLLAGQHLPRGAPQRRLSPLVRCEELRRSRDWNPGPSRPAR